MKFILFCVTLDLSDNLTEMHQIGQIVKNSNVTCKSFKTGTKFRTEVSTKVQKTIYLLPARLVSGSFETCERKYKCLMF